MIRYALQPASITFLAYEYEEVGIIDGATVPLKALPPHSTTVYRVQEAFNNVTLPDGVFVKAGWSGGQSSPASIMRMSVEMSAP